MKRTVHPSLTEDAANEIDSLLMTIINSHAAVIGVLVVSHGGTVLASLVADEIDVDLVAAAARDIFGCTMLAIKESNHQSQLHQMVCLTCQGYVVIANFGGGLLVTLTDTNDVGAVVSPAPFG